jgi:protein involved in polysaccharide export with SLBB domain
MRRVIVLVATLLFSCAAEAQTSNILIRPGDILIIKVLRPFRFLNLRSVPYSPPAGRELLASTTLVVNADGKIAPPRLQGMVPIEDITVESLSLVEAAKRVRESYIFDGPVFLEVSGVVAWGRVNIVIERATVGQVLSQ